MVAPAPQKKSKLGLILGCVGGCLVVLLGICGAGGYVAYLEEGQDRGDPGDEVMSIPIASGQGFELNVTWSGHGYADHIFWVVTPTALPQGTRITGEFACGSYGSRAIDREVHPAAMSRPEWLSLGSEHSEYMREGETVHCRGRVDGPIPPGTRLVVTTFQRPSDYFAN
jgi:hypothetical protein